MKSKTPQMFFNKVVAKHDFQIVYRMMSLMEFIFQVFNNIVKINCLQACTFIVKWIKHPMCLICLNKLSFYFSEFHGVSRLL